MTTAQRIQANSTLENTAKQAAFTPPFGVQLRNLSVRYGRTIAIDNLAADFRAGAIHGLLGRNGSGKTALLSVIAAFRKPSAGQVLVDGQDPFENVHVMAGTCLIRESGDVVGSDPIRTVLKSAAELRPLWDAQLAERLLDRFELPLKKTPDTLSRGKRAALGMVLGLASRAPLTIFDETYLGMDAPSRYAFYDELMATYIEHPRTIILSSHLTSEVEKLLEHVLILKDGKHLLSADTDDLRARGVSLTGPAKVVDRFTSGMTVLASRSLGNTKEVTLFENLDEAAQHQAKELGLELGPVAVQDLFIHLTEKGRDAHATRSA